MNLPRLNRKLTLEAPARVYDNSGGYVTVWEARGIIWAQVTARTGRETATASAPVSKMQYRIVVRGALPGSPERPRPEQRFREGNRLFVIQAVSEEDPQGRYLTCFATEETAV